MKRLIFAAYIIAGAGIILLLAVPVEGPVAFLLRAAYLQTGLTVILLGIPLLLAVRHYLQRITVLAVMICVAAPIAMQWSATGDPEIEEGSLKVLSFSGMTRTSNEADLELLLQTQEADIACLQEFLPGEALSRVLATYPSSIVSPGGQAIASVHPMTLVRDENYLVHVVAEITNGLTLNIVNVHMPRLYRGREADGMWRNLLGLVANAEPPLLVCGDFNVTPFNNVYHVMTKDLGLINAHEVAGRGFGFTFPSGGRRLGIMGPQIRIDHIFVRGGVPTQAATHNGSNASDHLAISARITGLARRGNE